MVVVNRIFVRARILSGARIRRVREYIVSLAAGRGENRIFSVSPRNMSRRRRGGFPSLVYPFNSRIKRPVRRVRERLTVIFARIGAHEDERGKRFFVRGDDRRAVEVWSKNVKRFVYRYRGSKNRSRIFGRAANVRT